MAALRLRPVAGGLPSPRIIPAEGMMVGDHFIAGNVCRAYVISISDDRRLSVYHYGHSSMTDDSSLILIHLFPRGGLNLNERKKLVSKKPSFPFSMEGGLV
jgi:hypothetical protein